MEEFLSKNKLLLQISLILFAIIIFTFPGYVFFSNRGGLDTFTNLGFESLLALIFPLFGLYGFTLIWLQIMIGSNIRYLMRLWPKVLRFHQYEGIFAFVVVSTHILLIILTFSFEKFLGAQFLPENQRFYGILGNFAFYLLTLSLLAAWFRGIKVLRKHWRKVHYLNYLIFLMVFVHSWNLGSDTQPTNLKYLWYFFAFTVILSLLGKYLLKPNRLQN